ncbi:hypothetical protein ACVWXQ_000368 [Bradyrhizobium sp. S3.14.4]
MTTRTLFVTHRAPNRPYKDSQVVNAKLKEASRRRAAPSSRVQGCW